MIKYTNYIFIICLFIISCGKELSETDKKLQGDWKFVKIDPKHSLFGGNILHTIKFPDNDFEATGKYVSDTDPTKEFVVRGKFYSDSTYIYLHDLEENQNNMNFIRNANNDPITTIKYKFNVDALILAIYEKGEDLEINANSPTQYFTK